MIRAMLKGGLKTRHQSFELDDCSDVNQSQSEKKTNYFLQGLFTNLSNPKTLIYFSSVFSLALTASANQYLKMQLALIIPIQTFLVFALFMLIMSMPKVKQCYQRSGSYIDICSGALFLIFAVWLWWDAILLMG